MESRSDPRPDPDGSAAPAQLGGIGGLAPSVVLEALDEGVLVQSATGQVLAVNAAAGRILGLPSDRLAGADKSAFEGPTLRSDGTPFPPEELPGRRAVRTATAQLGVVVGLTGKHRATKWVEINSRPLIEEGIVVAVVSSLRDITEKREMEQSLRESERRQRLLLEHAVGGYVIVADDGQVLAASGTLLRPWIRPIDEGAVAGLDRVHLDDRHEAEQVMKAARAQPGPHRVELRALDVTGQDLWVELTATDHRDDPAIAGVVINFSDITERKQIEHALAHEATHDIVTGLPNRRQLTARLDKVLADPDRVELVGVIFFDVDQFKLVNDSIGHPAGDEILIEVADRLRGGIGPDDTVSRFGGDEFVVMCERVASIADVVATADRIMARFETPLTVDGSDRTVTLSGGVTVATGATTSSDLLREADTALNMAKERGRARVEVFSDEIRDQTARRIALETDLRRALGRDELRLAYQPVVDVATGRAVGCEALLRWDHPRLGTVGPSEFIPLAEKIGLIGAVGDRVIRRAVDQLRTWAASAAVPDDFWMAVNVSAVQLADPSFVDAVAGVIGESALDPRRLHLEITESVLMEDARTSIAQLEQLRDLGVRIDVDDFGTGYSSLAYLKRLPISTLKIDRSFVAGLGSDPHDTSIVRAIISLGRALDLELVAEGVETATQLTELRDLGCGQAQGYYWLEPLPPDEIVAWAASTRA